METNRILQRFTVVAAAGGVKTQEFGKGSLSPPKKSPGRDPYSLETEEMRRMTQRFSQLNQRSRMDTELNKEKEMRIFKQLRSDIKLKR